MICLTSFRELRFLGHVFWIDLCPNSVDGVYEPSVSTVSRSLCDRIYSYILVDNISVRWIKESHFLFNHFSSSAAAAAAGATMNVISHLWIDVLVLVGKRMKQCLVTGHKPVEIVAWHFMPRSKITMPQSQTSYNR